METPALSDALREGNVSVYRHVVPGLYLAMTLNHSGGMSLRWFRDTLCRWERERAQAVGQDPYDRILSGAPEGPTDLLVLPHFAGSGTPWLDTTSKGAILGLTFVTTQATMAKALLEGLTFELRVNLDLLRGAGVKIDELHAVGGGARSPLWVQLKADICQVPLRVPNVTEAACLGAALLAGVAAGVYPDLRTAVARTVHLEQRIEPHDDRVAAYDRRYQVHCQVYPALISLLRQI
jgi:xylulokinase